jgi:hypothetical protein
MNFKQQNTTWWTIKEKKRYWATQKTILVKIYSNILSKLLNITNYIVQLRKTSEKSGVGAMWNETNTTLDEM